MRMVGAARQAFRQGQGPVACAIHNQNARRDRTFVRLNCAAIPSGLLESELFGYEKGAFTGALAQKRGRIDLGVALKDLAAQLGLDDKIHLVEQVGRQSGAVDEQWKG